MSLELAIERNTTALNTLIDILSKGAAPADAFPPPSPPPGTPSVTLEETLDEPVKPAPESKAPTYEEASSAVTAVIKAKGTPAAKAVLKEFGVSNLKQLDKARYAEIIEAAWKVALS